MARRGWWRSIPPELGVPIAISGLVQLVSGLAADPRASAYLFVAVSTVPAILELCGLRELRRRLTGTPARLIGVAAGVQMFVVARIIVSQFSFLLGIDREIWFAITLWALLAEAVCLALVVGIAAGAWRSILGPLLVVAAVLDDVPRLMIRWFMDVLGDREAIQVYFALVQVVYKVALLASYGRLGAAVQAGPEPARAVRAARRVAISQWLRVGAVAIGMAPALALEALGWRSSEAVFSLAAFAIIGTVAGTISGLLGLARSHIVGLSPLALCVAAFGALWLAFAGEAQTVATYLRELDTGPSAWFVGVTLACFLCVAAGAIAIRRYAVKLGDRPLAHVLSNRLAQIVALDLVVVGCLALARPDTATEIVGLVVSLLVLHTAANAALADMFARLGPRVKLAAAADVF